MTQANFEWDSVKNLENQQKHGINFFDAQYAFADPNRIIAIDAAHSETEPRYFCFGKVNDGILTVRFTYRGATIRLIGAGYWRKGRAIYERENQLPR